MTSKKGKKCRILPQSPCIPVHERYPGHSLTGLQPHHFLPRQPVEGPKILTAPTTCPDYSSIRKHRPDSGITLLSSKATFSLIIARCFFQIIKVCDGIGYTCPVIAANLGRSSSGHSAIRLCRAVACIASRFFDRTTCGCSARKAAEKKLSYHPKLPFETIIGRSLNFNRWGYQGH